MRYSALVTLLVSPREQGPDTEIEQRNNRIAVHFKAVFRKTVIELGCAYTEQSKSIRPRTLWIFFSVGTNSQTQPGS